MYLMFLGQDQLPGNQWRQEIVTLKQVYWQVSFDKQGMIFGVLVHNGK